jgi:hypothetical protein
MGGGLMYYQNNPLHSMYGPRERRALWMHEDGEIMVSDVLRRAWPSPWPSLAAPKVSTRAARGRQTAARAPRRPGTRAGKL